jgi:carbonic anhydrase
MSYYQSPIPLHYKNAIFIDEYMHIHGKNEESTYNEDKKIFEVNDPIILHKNHKSYYLDEYHFHTPAEHIINPENKHQSPYEGEIHYVFVETELQTKPKNKSCIDICGCGDSKGKNIVVIGRTISENKKIKELNKIQVKLPNSYFEYDGTLTTEPYSSVRWVMGEIPICMSINKIIPKSKPARPLQKLDNRIILYSS